MTVRMATAYREMWTIPGYDHRVIVAVEIRDPQPSGQPQGEEFDQLAEVETALSALLEADNESLGVLAITGCGTRDLIYYTRNPTGAMTRLQSAIADVKSHRYQFAIEPDSAWELYGYFNRLVGQTSAPCESN